MRQGRGLALALACVLSVGLTSAWGDVAQPPTGEQPAPALKGPRVRERHVAGGEFGGGDKRRMVDRLPPQVYREGLGVLTSPDAPEEIRATAEQRERVKALIEGHEAAVKEYRAQHREEFAAMEKTARARRQKAAEGEMMPPPENDPAMEEVRVRRRELMEGAPKIEGVYEKIWAMLTPAQQKAVEAKLQEFRDEQARKREEMYVRQRMSDRKDVGAAKDVKARDAKDGAPAAKGAEPGAPVRPRAAAAERRERLIKMFERLTPEEQEALLARLEQRMAERREPERKDKPRPDPEQVKVPKPDNGR